jgi:hypothetical protein
MMYNLSVQSLNPKYVLFYILLYTKNKKIKI